MQEWVHPCQNGPKEIHWRPEVSRDSLCHRELWSPGGGRATKAKVAVQPKPRGPCRGDGTPRRPHSRQQHRSGRREAGVCPATWALLHPLLLRVAWRGPGVRRNGGQVWAMPWSSRHPAPTTARLGLREEQLGLCTYVTHKTYQKKNRHNNFY